MKYVCVLELLEVALGLDTNFGIDAVTVFLVLDSHFCAMLPEIFLTKAYGVEISTAKSVFKSCVRNYKPASVRRTGMGRGDPRCCYPSPSNLHCSLTFSGFSHNFNQIPTGEEWKKFIQKPLHTNDFFFQEMKGSVFIFFSFFFSFGFFQLFCSDVKPSQIFSCLKKNKNDQQMERRWTVMYTHQRCVLLSFIFTKDETYV